MNAKWTSQLWYTCSVIVGCRCELQRVVSCCIFVSVNTSDPLQAASSHIVCMRYMLYYWFPCCRLYNELELSFVSRICYYVREACSGLINSRFSFAGITTKVQLRTDFHGWGVQTPGATDQKNIICALIPHNTNTPALLTPHAANSYHNIGTTAEPLLLHPTNLAPNCFAYGYQENALVKAVRSWNATGKQTHTGTHTKLKAKRWIWIFSLCKIHFSDSNLF